MLIKSVIDEDPPENAPEFGGRFLAEKKEGMAAVRSMRMRTGLQLVDNRMIDEDANCVIGCRQQNDR